MKKAVTLIRQITSGNFLIEQSFADAFLPSIVALLKGKQVSFYDESEEENEAINAAYILKPQGSAFEMDFELSENLPENSIGVLQLRGVVMKETFCGVPGTAALAEMLKEMAAHPKIGSVLFIHDSGGGAVDGTFELSDIMADVAKNKPIVGFVDGTCASASYAILSQCSKLYASHRSSKVGSIGVCTSLRDYSEYLKKNGVADHYINAETNPDKNLAYLNAKKGDYKLLQQNILNPLHAIFKETVKRGRETVKDEALTGDVYLAEKALEMGLIDGISTLEDSLNEAFRLSIEKQ